MTTASTEVAVPQIDYLSRDYDGLVASLLQYAAAAFPDWQPSSQGDIGMVFLELMAYVGDILSFYTDRAQMENYLATATQRQSILNIAYLLGYVPGTGTPATGTVTLTTSSPSVDVPAGTQISTGRIDAIDGPIIFETDTDATVTSGVDTAFDVTEGSTVSYALLGTSNGLPNQTFLLPNPGVYDDTCVLWVEDPTGSTQFYQGTTLVTARQWNEVTHLLDAGPTDNVFELDLNSDNSSTVLLGDDINGAIPPTGVRVWTTYRWGYGSTGNVVAGSVYLINSQQLKTVTVVVDPTTGTYESSAMLGGADPESTDSIRYNAPRAYRTQQRAINAGDFTALALGIPGVSKANVVAGSFTSVTVYICGPNGQAPTEALQDSVATAFTDTTLIGVSLTVASPDFIPVNFGTTGSPVALIVADQYSQSTVTGAVTNAIQSYLNSMPFGQQLTVYDIYTAVSAVDGVLSIDIPVMARNDSEQSGTSPITPRVWEVFSLGSVNISASGGVS